MPNTTAVRTAQVGAAPFFAGKNAIINGDFRINQRNFSSTTSNNTYGHDRWSLQTNSTCTYSTQTFTSGAAPVAGYEGVNFARMATTTNSSSGEYVIFQYKIEDVRTLAGQTATVSFWAKASSGTPKLGVEIGQIFGSGGSANVSGTGQAVTLSTSWARYSLTFSVPSISGKTVGTSSYVEFNFWCSAGSTFNTRSGTVGNQSATIDIWGVQMEAGSVATAFQTATGTLGGELAACQRYYEKSYALATAVGTASVSQAFNGFYTVGTNQKMVNPGLWKVQKRTSPTVTVYDDAGNSGKISTLDTGGTATNNVAIAIIDTDDSSFRALGSSNGTQAGYKWNWVASAEL